MVVRIDYLSIYILILYISAATCLITSISCFKRKPALGAFPLGILLVSIAGASILHALVYSVQGLQNKLLVSNLRYMGIELIPFSFLALTYEHTKKLSFFRAKRVLPILSLAFIFFLLAITNQYHFWFYKSAIIQGNILILENGPGFWLDYIYIYALSTIGVAYLLSSLLDPFSYSKRQTSLLLLAGIFPIFFNIISIFGIVYTGNIDLTPPAFSFTGLMSFFFMFKLRMFDLVPIARAGSSFIFSIPFEIAQAPNESAKRSISDDDFVFNNINIIAAEDSKVNQDLLRMLLAKKKLKADFADNGEILLQMLELKKYELVLMDMQMPEVDGLEATSMIREMEKETGEHLIIIALTANAMKGDRELCISSGMDDYLAKPLRYKELSDMINKYFR